MYRIGLDIGIASVGWAVLETNSDGNPIRIINLGSYVFDAAENPKNGASLAKPRRDARGARRRLRRHKFRLQRIKKHIVRYGILSRDELEHLYDVPGEDIYRIRVEALDRVLDDQEFARLLIHLAQRRGFRSNRRVDAKDQDEGKLLSAVNENARLMKERGYRTVGEMLYKDPKFSTAKRNKEESYSNTVSRSQMEDEVRRIFEAQRKCGNQKASEELEKEYLDIYLSQRSFEEGPGGNAGDYCPYSGNQIEKMVGHCTFEPDEKRAVKASYTFERANLLQNINKMQLIDENGEMYPLNEEQRHVLVERAHQTASLDYSKIRKTLNLKETERFAYVDYNQKSTFESAEKKQKFEYLKHYHELRKALNSVEKDLIQKCPVQVRDEIGTILTYYKTDLKIRAALDKIEDPFLTEEVKDAVMGMSGCSGVGSLSLKALNNIMPYLEQGMMYDKAAEAAGYHFRGHDRYNKGMYLPNLSEDDDIRNPVVRRAVSQTIKVVNAIIKKYGKPVAINVELARETARTFEDRQKILKQQKKNREANQKTKRLLQEEFHLLSPSHLDILKDRLFKEQDGICLYSGEKIDRTRLFEDGYVQIDHIVPYSISWDDSYSNKVLVMTRENQQKGNRLPMEYLNGKKQDEFCVRVERQIRDLRKKTNLLMKSIPADKKETFKDRNLNDTKYICRFMLNYLNDHILFDQSVDMGKRVTALNGSVTAYLRKRWGLNKVRGNGDKHHALDAVVIGCINNSLIMRVTQYFKHRENFLFEPEQHVQKKAEAPSPWPNFREEVEFRMADNPKAFYDRLSTKISLTNYSEEELEQVKPIFVSRMKVKKKTGSANDATIRGLKVLEDGQMVAISKVPLSTLRLDKNGEIKSYYHKEDDRLLYNALKERLEEYGGNGEKAFTEPFYKPKANGEQGPLVRKVKVAEKITNGVVLNHGEGIASNGSMLRADFYRKNGKYYAVPVYVKDMVNDHLPDRAVTLKHPYDQWDKMDDNDFLFSLYPNDVVYIRFNKPKNGKVVNEDSTLNKNESFDEIYGYYKALGIATNSITVITNDNSYRLDSIGIKTLPEIKKCAVDVLGNLIPVARETRKHR